MADNHRECGPVDSERIELSEDHEFRYWTTRLGCTAEQLVVALQTVGVSATAVGTYLGALAQPGAAHGPDERERSSAGQVSR
jgi:hypothetical protein